ncbi:MAG: PBSX family phage terminase large subunit [Ruminococcus sp.]|nr:PBSX family phage terminase large subunit [Ruminococcus sp.]
MASNRKTKLLKRKKTIPYNFGDKHKNYIKRSADCMINVAEGAVRAGKTVDNVLAFCHELKSTKDKIHLASASTLGNAKIILGDCNGFGIEHYFRGQCRWGKYKGNDALIIRGPDTGYKERIVIFSGAMLASSYKSIRGNSYGMWIATEINLHHKSFVQEAFNRSIAAVKRKIWWDLNPDNPKSWIYTEYIDKYQQDTASGKFLGGYNYEHFTIDDNINITDERKAEVKSQYDPTSIWYKRDILGLRIRAEGIIFQDFANNTDKYIIDSINESEITSIQVGIDFGGNKSKTTFVAVGFVQGFKNLVVLDDEKIEGTKGEVDPVVIYKRFISFIRRLYNRYNPLLIKYAWADNEAQTLINGLRNACRRAKLFINIMDCYKAPVNDRISTLALLMAQGRFSVLRQCKNVIGSLSEQIWDPRHETEDVRLDDGTCDIDTADALEYSFSKFIKAIVAVGGVNGEY